MIRKSNKSVLAQEVKKDVKFSTHIPEAIHVIDGGSLLHIVRWNTPCTYADIVDKYVSYVEIHYGASNIIVFDGYQSGPTTKDMEQGQRSRKMLAKVIVDPKNIARGPQPAFLANSANKAELINLLKGSLI